MLMIIGSVLLFVAGILGLVILINAFSKGGAAQGLLCMFVPFYILYYAFAKYSSPKKALVVGGWLGGLVLGVTLQVVGGLMAVGDAAADFEAEMARLDTTDFANAPTGGAAAEEGGRTVICNMKDQPGRVCAQYALSSTYTQENAAEHCEMTQVLVENKVGVTEGTCPTDDAVAKCEPTFGSITTVYYRDPDPSIDQEQALSSMETLCVGTFTRL